MNPNDIKELWIRQNDDGTYNITIETSGYNIDYPRTKISFICNNAIAFPATIQVLNSDDETVNTYSLVTNMNNQQDDTSGDNNEQV